MKILCEVRVTTGRLTISCLHFQVCLGLIMTESNNLIPLNQREDTISFKKRGRNEYTDVPPLGIDGD